MRGHADRLVDDHDVVVVVHDPDPGHLVRHHDQIAALVVEVDLQHRARADPIGLAPDRGPVDPYPTGDDQLTAPGPGQAQHAGHRRIDPLTLQALGHQHDLQLSHGRAAPRRRRRS